MGVNGPADRGVGRSRPDSLRRAAFRRTLAAG